MLFFAGNCRKLLFFAGKCRSGSAGSKIFSPESAVSGLSRHPVRAVGSGRARHHGRPDCLVSARAGLHDQQEEAGGQSGWAETKAPEGWSAYERAFPRLPPWFGLRTSGVSGSLTGASGWPLWASCWPMTGGGFGPGFEAHLWRPTCRAAIVAPTAEEGRLAGGRGHPKCDLH